MGATRRDAASLRARVAPRSEAASATTLLVLTEGAPSLVREACRHARANHEHELHCLYVPSSGHSLPDAERRALEAATGAALEEGLRALPVTHAPGSAADAVIRAAEETGARVILINGAERCAWLARLLGRRTLRRIRRRLSPERSVLAYD